METVMKMFLGGMKQYHFFKENKMFKLQYNTFNSVHVYCVFIC